GACRRCHTRAATVAGAGRPCRPGGDRRTHRGRHLPRRGQVRGGLDGCRMITPIAVVGPTASGKSALGIELAQRLDGEVVNVDSMQLYRGMDIGTAKLTVEE